MSSPRVFSLSGAARALSSLALGLLLAACGGGGGDGDAKTASAASTAFNLPTQTALAPSASLAGVCSVEGEQAFARSYLDETYLWWDRVPAVDAAKHATVRSYFEALLLRTPDASGRPIDRFSAVLEQAQADAMLLSMPMAGVLTTGGYAVPFSSTVTSPGGRQVGYLLFNQHGRGAQDALIAAFEALRQARVQDLVLDLRHNPGGYLYVAQAVASMVAGPTKGGQVFEELRYSERRTAEGAGRTMRLSTEVQVKEKRYPVGHPLPTLSLPRLYVLASGLTCSASESIVNGLRGVGIEVVIVGETTCGKPYGFHRKDNCGKTYFAVEFQGVNAAGFGDYNGGFSPTCPVTPDALAHLGDPHEALFAAALHHIDTGSCPAPTGSMAFTHKRAIDPLAGLEGRLLEPQ